MPIARVAVVAAKTRRRSGPPIAALAGAYEDPAQAAVPFGAISYDRAPWRAYMDTWPASRFLAVPGINLNLDDPNQVGPLAQLLAEAGVRVARVEIGWGTLDFDDPTTLQPFYHSRQLTRLRALRDAGLRPLILLNAHHGLPCPRKRLDVTATASAAAGARTLTLSGDLAAIVPHKTGLTQAGKSGFPLITAADAGTGACALSAPLAADVPAGPLALWTHRYHPFSPPTFADGAPNPLCQETLDGWVAYVRAVAALALEAGLAPGGWDFEVWNEYTFGSQFLQERNYYNPERAYTSLHIPYSNHGLTFAASTELLLPMTVDLAAAEWPGVNVISGFANQRPWDNGAEMWPGQAGFSRHYYTGVGNGAVAPDARAVVPEVDALGATRSLVTLLAPTPVAPGETGAVASAALDTAAGGAAWTGVGLQYHVDARTLSGGSIAVAVTVEESADGATGWSTVPGEGETRTFAAGTERWGADIELPTAGRLRYVRLRLEPSFDPAASGSATVQARGKTAFVPPGLRRDCPEIWHYAYQTEFVTRDIQPIGPSLGGNDFDRHHRFSIRAGFPGLARTARVWMTEHGTFRVPWANAVKAEAGVASDDPALVELSFRITAKCVLREWVFGAHKGLDTLCVFAVRGGQLAHAHVPDAFFTTLAAQGFQVNATTRAAFGEPMRVLKRVRDLMAAATLPSGAVPRKLTVEQVAEHGPRRVFRGNGTAARPDRWHREDLAVLPYQLAAGRYAVGIYVVTRDAAAVYDPSKGPLDPARYRFPEQPFTLRLGNVRGTGAAVGLYDPITDQTSTPVITAATATALTVRLPVVDYPRFLILDEAQDGPLILDPVVDTAAATPTLTFSTNLAAAPSVTWGVRPGRTSRGSASPSSGTAHAVALTGLAAGEAARAAVTVDGLTCFWPQWGHDVAGWWQV